MASGAFTADELRTRREALGLTQMQLAEALGVYHNTIAKWERGDQTISQPKLLRLALAALRAQAAS